jgi:glycosyltransferase involved in cell wall biosynthesis
MKITYTSPNRSHHYPYADSLNNLGALHAFVSGFSRFSPRSPLPSVGDKLKRHDFFQNIYLGLSKLKLPYSIRQASVKLANVELDLSSYKWAEESDAFIFYRTQGYYTTKRLKRNGSNTLCVMEEVNSHVDNYHEVLHDEYRRLNTNKGFEFDADTNLRKEMYEKSDAILCPSEFVRRSFIKNGFDASKIIKVNFGFPISQNLLHRTEKGKDDTFRVLYVGQIHYRKGLRYALEAFKKLKHSNKEFIVVGPTAIITGLENYQIPSNVVFKGVLKGEALQNEYLRASVFVLPSIEEGLALVQGEALSNGLPLIITTNTGGDDFVTDGKEGFIVPIQNSDTIYEKFQFLADNIDIQNEMSVNALATANKLGSWKTAGIKLIEEIVRLKS